MRTYYQYSPGKIKTGKIPKLDLSLHKKTEVESDNSDLLPGTTARNFAVIGKLESTVSRIQIAQNVIGKLVDILDGMHSFMENQSIAVTKGIKSPDVINNFLKEQLDKIDDYVANSTFQGVGLLNGESGVTGRTTRHDLRFIKGSSRTRSIDIPGSPVTIYQAASAASLTGHLPLNEKLLKRESAIIIKDGQLQMRYQIKKGETPESLIYNLQGSLLNYGLDIKVAKTADHKLCLIHNQLGSEVNFFATGTNTDVISDFPGLLKQSIPGKDIVGRIGTEQASGKGGFLIGNRGNQYSDGVVLYFDGKIKFPGEIIGYVQIQQNGICVPLDPGEEKEEILSIPPLSPRQQAVGVSNGSTFCDLGSINVGTREQGRDAIKLILWAISDLKRLRQELQRKEDSFVNRTIEFLKGSVRPLEAGEEIMGFSKDKAGEMAGQLRLMLSHEIVA